MDCLDRTNIVQTAIARNVLEIQFRKVGLLPPEVNLPADCRTKYQEIWANNGDALSRQYAGTAAKDDLMCVLEAVGQDWRALQ